MYLNYKTRITKMGSQIQDSTYITLLNLIYVISYCLFLRLVEWLNAWLFLQLAYTFIFGFCDLCCIWIKTRITKKGSQIQDSTYITLLNLIYIISYCLFLRLVEWLNAWFFRNWPTHLYLDFVIIVVFELKPGLRKRGFRFKIQLT